MSDGNSSLAFLTIQLTNIQKHVYMHLYLCVSDFGEGGAPDPVGFYAAVEKLLLQFCPGQMSRADL